MKVLLLGANGQLGHDLLRYYHNHEMNFSLQTFTRLDLDLLESEKIIRTLLATEFDVLINCSAYSNVALAEKEKEIAYALNTKAVELIAQACHKKNTRLIHISTDYVFDGKSEKPYLEKDEVNPLNAYGLSKYKGELQANKVHDDIVIFRTASLFGASGFKSNCESFLYKIVKIARQTGKISVVCDQIMSPTWTYDLAGMIFSSIENPIPPGVYHATSGGVASWFDLAEYTLQQLKIDAQISPVFLQDFPSEVMRPLYSALDCQLLDSILVRRKHWKQSVNDFLLDSMVDSVHDIYSLSSS